VHHLLTRSSPASETERAFLTALSMATAQPHNEALPPHPPSPLTMSFLGRTLPPWRYRPQRMGVAGPTIFLLALLTLGAITFFHTSTSEPRFAQLRALERGLPQHNLALPFPEGTQGRYLRFSNQARGTGWNNVLSDLYAGVNACLSACTH
jgi:hypothetical protein